MTFAWPHLLWLIAVPVLVLIWEIIARRRTVRDTVHPKIRRAEISANSLQITIEPALITGRRIRPWLALGLIFAVVALARPQWGRIDEPVFDQSREILIAIDLSRSMMSPDVRPSRLDRSKLLVQALLEKLKGERVGLIVFSGTAFLQSPLSSDYEILREFLPSLKPDFLPEGGTNYRGMIDAAIEAFGAGTAADRFLIVLSDGEATDDSWQSAADQLREKGVRVIALGVGTSAGSMIPDGSGGFVKDERGAVVLSKLESGTLQQLAELSHGTYRDASGWLDLASLIDQTVNAGRKGEFVDKASVRLVERFQWPLAFALWCLLVSAYYEFPVQPRARDVALRPTPVPPRSKSAANSAAIARVATALLLGLLSAPVAHAAVKKSSDATQEPSAAANPADAPGTPAALGKIVARLSQKPTLTSPDLSEFAHETLTWGQRLKEAGQPVPEGPVNDAIEAVDRLIAAGEKLADWQKLRAELQALLEKPEAQKPPPKPQNKNDSKQDDKSQQNPKQGQDGQSQKQSDKPQKQDDKSSKQDQQPSEKNHSQPSNKQQSSPSPAEKKAENKPDEPLAFGDMKKSPPPPPAREMQKVGGAQEKKDAPPADPALAVPTEKLDQLRNQDDPAKLFQLMQSEQSHGKPAQNGKNW
jgi:Ca-activated chloride channel family protein